MTNPQVYVFRGAEISDNAEPLHYTQCGLDDIFLINGFRRLQVGGEESVAIQEVEGLQKAIALNVVRNKALLNGKEVRFLRKLLDFTQAEIGLWLGYTSQQVARWEKGEGKINPSADKLLRVIYTASFHEKGLNILETIRELAELDAQTNERQFFRETDEGWKAAA